MIFSEKKNSLHYFYLQTVNIVQKSKNLRNIIEIADYHNFGREYARNVKVMP